MSRFKHKVIDISPGIRYFLTTYMIRCIPEGNQQVILSVFFMRRSLPGSAIYFKRCNETTEGTVFDVEPFGHELKAERLRRNEKYSVVSKRINRRS